MADWGSNGVKVVPQKYGDYLMLTVTKPATGHGWICQAERINARDEQMFFSGLCAGGDSLESAQAAAEKIALDFLD